MTAYETNQMIIENIKRNMQHPSKYTLYDRKSIMKHAHRIFKKGVYSFSECLKQAWESAKRTVTKCREEMKSYREQLSSFYTPQPRPLNQESVVKFFKSL